MKKISRPSGDHCWFAAPNSPEVRRFGTAGFDAGVAGGDRPDVRRAIAVHVAAPGTPFARYLASVMTRTSLSRLFGSFFALLSAASSSGRAVDEAMVRPSGDHAGFPAPRGMSVTARPSPPFIGITKICGGCTSSLSAARTKASRVPSGDHRGAVSRGPAVRRRGGSRPSESAIQIAVSY